MTPADNPLAADDARLKALFALDEPPPRDMSFSAEVMAKVMRQRFREEVAMLSGVSVVGAGALWLVWPTLQAGLIAVSQSLAPAAGAMALAAGVALVAGLWRPAPLHGVES